MLEKFGWAGVGSGYLVRIGIIEDVNAPTKVLGGLRPSGYIGGR